jgi:streptogramin lyase
MLGPRNSRLDPDWAGDEGLQRPERVRGASSRHRRHRPVVECLEDRRLLSAITEFPLPAGDEPAGGLTVGPDRNLWFTDSSGIGRITPAGAFTQFTLPAAPGDLTVGPDGNLWFTESNAIGRITPSGTLTEFSFAAGSGSPGGLTVGPDGNLWFIHSAAIDRITPLGTITVFSLPTAGFGADVGASDLTVGPDGNLWFTEYSSNPNPPFTDLPGPVTIDRITPAGAFTEFPLPTAGFGDVGASDLTVGPGGDLWFIEYSFYPNPLHGGYPGPSAIDRITPAGAVTVFSPGYHVVGADSLTVGADGNVWFTDDGAIDRITPAGTVTEFPLFTPGSHLSNLTVGPDGNLWFALQVVPSSGSGAGFFAIGRITLAGASTTFRLPAASGSPGDLTVGPDGNLWFPEDNPGRIEKIVLDAFPPPPSVTGVLAVAHSRKAITSILLGFDEALAPASASKGRFYGLAAGVTRGQTIVYSKPVKIARVSYDRAAHAVRLKLAVPQKGSVQVTVRAGLMAADGMSSFSDFTAVVM